MLLQFLLLLTTMLPMLWLSLSFDFDMKIDVEHPQFDKISIGNIEKVKRVIIWSESSSSWRAIIDEDLFPEIVAYSLPFSYIF